jgi:hypothetical protein
MSLVETIWRKPELLKKIRLKVAVLAQAWLFAIDETLDCLGALSLQT